MRVLGVVRCAADGPEVRFHGLFAVRRVLLREERCLVGRRVLQAVLTSSDCNRVYLRKKVKRSTPVSQEEQAARNLFSQISKAMALRRKDINTMVQDQQAFQAQKDSPNGYKTIYSYLWHVVADSLNG